MRTPLVVGTALGILALTAGPASACQLLTPRSCAATGGTYAATSHGFVRTCTTTTVADQASAPSPLPAESIDWSGVTVDYTGTEQDVVTVQTSTTQTQRGLGRITSETTTTVLATTRTVLTCVVTADVLGTQSVRVVDPSVCARPQDHPPSSLFA